MGLTWMLVVIVGCVALAVCIAAVLLRPMRAERRRLRPLANSRRLTLLPEYARAVRAGTIAAVLTIVLLAVMFAGSVIVAARPCGLPTAAAQYGGGDPEDVMLCIGAPPADPAVNAALSYFAQSGRHLRHAAHRHDVVESPGDPADAGLSVREADAVGLRQARRPTRRRGGVLGHDVYVDYSANLDDLLTLCLTGFPDFDQTTAQRRSLIYVGPDTSPPGGPALFTPTGCATSRSPVACS